MQKEFQNIFNKVKHIKLSPAEKEKMRAVLMSFIEKHPVRNAASISHLLQERSKSNIPAFMELFKLKSLISKLQPMIIALIIALMIGGSTSLAAERALPGDILYPVKVNVNEEVRSLVTFSSEAQALWDARRAERRLEEVEQLAAEGRLNAETRADIESRFESHAEAFQEGAKKTETKQNTQASLEVYSNFNASLQAHEHALGQIAAEKTDMRREVEPLLAEVRSRLGATIKARSDAEAQVSAEENGGLKTAAEGKLGAAENKIREVRNFIDQVKASVSANAKVQAEAKLNTAVEVIARGETEMEAQLYGKSFASFQEAIRIAQEAKLLLSAEKRINLEIKLSREGVKNETSPTASPAASPEASP